MLAYGVNVQDRVAIFAQNMPNWTITDLAVLQIRAITVPIYATNNANQTAYVLNHSEAKIIFVGDQEQLDVVLSIAENCPHLEKIVLMKPNLSADNPRVISWDDLQAVKNTDFSAILAERLAERSLSDLFTILYTSGTTGEPKGVMLDFANFGFTSY